MAKRDEEVAVEAVVVDRLIELSTAYTWIRQQKVGAVDRHMEFYQHQFTDIRGCLKLLTGLISCQQCFRFSAYSSQFRNLFLIQIQNFGFLFFVDSVAI